MRMFQLPRMPASWRNYKYKRLNRVKTEICLGHEKESPRDH